MGVWLLCRIVVYVWFFIFVCVVIDCWVRRNFMLDYFISCFVVLFFDVLFDDIVLCICKVFEKLGFILNVFFVFVYCLDEFCVFFVYYDVLMECDGGLIKVECEMIVVVILGVNYC